MSPPPSLLRVNDRALTAAPGETVLQAALRAGLPFPNACRVGGCGTCKCRVVDGAVRELTETGYLLTAEELERRTILACQSVPLGEVHVEVAWSGASRRVEGTVLAQERVTHDLTRLRVQPAAPVDFRPGQSARLSVAALPGVCRSYSFGAPPRADGVLDFYVRRAPGGQFSGVVHEHSLVGTTVQLEGPDGEFWLRDGQAPLVMVAGGSGLPPMLAMLEAALAAGDPRPVTLLFGARAQRDLYALDRIEALRRGWVQPRAGGHEPPPDFRFVPVLSQASGDDGWTGARGLVTDHLGAALSPRAEVYVCGPPAMVDAAVTLLGGLGVASSSVHVDRFTPSVPTPPSPIAGVADCAKFLGFHFIGLVAALSLLAGGPGTILGLVGVVGVYVLGDALLGDDTRTPRYRHPRLMTAQLWLALPLLAFIVWSAIWSVCTSDPLGFGAWLGRLSGYDLLGARAASGLGAHLAGGLLTGLMIGMTGTIPAHELTHRTWDRVSMVVGRWLLAFSFDTAFAIEHVYGHHRSVATAEDPATAPRGRSVYAHVVLSTVLGNRSAWRIEVARLRKKRRSLFSPHNAFLRGQLMSLVLLVGAFAMGGWSALAFFTACALWGKALLEIVNYMEHYGLVRLPGAPILPRHSWNSNHRLSSWTMFNLTRHSHHHAQGEVPYHDLRPLADAPMMISGYLTTIIVTLVPPLWTALMAPKLRAWDEHWASPEERALLARTAPELEPGGTKRFHSVSR